MTCLMRYDIPYYTVLYCIVSYSIISYNQACVHAEGERERERGINGKLHSCIQNCICIAISIRMDASVRPKNNKCDRSSTSS